jgi:ABC-2 type transport system ATP-binding protein
MMEEAVVLDRVTKVFAHDHAFKVTAVNDLSLQIRRGEIFSLVGPDGAGKTTAIRMMCGVLHSTQGSISLVGLDMKKDRDEIKKRIGYLSQRFSLYGDLSVDENIDFFAEIHRVKNYKERKEELLQFMRLTSFRDRLAARLSGGMKQKLALACTLVHTPEIIFLDEPTTGVDPVSRRDFWKILSSLLKSGITVVVTTPYLDEAERSTRIALVNEGKLLACDTPEHIRSSFSFGVLEVVCSDVRAAATVLQERLEKERVQLFGDRLHVLVAKGTNEESTVLEMLRQSSVELTSARLIAASLEDVFIANLKS